MVVAVILSGLVGLWVGYLVGYRSAHLLIAEECKRLGGFFVNDEVFWCELVEGPDLDGGDRHGPPIERS